MNWADQVLKVRWKRGRQLLKRVATQQRDEHGSTRINTEGNLATQIIFYVYETVWTLDVEPQRSGRKKTLMRRDRYVTLVHSGQVLLGEVDA